MIIKRGYKNIYIKGKTQTSHCYYFNQGHPTRFYVKSRIEVSDVSDRLPTNKGFTQAAHYRINIFGQFVMFQNANAIGQFPVLLIVTTNFVYQ